VIQVIMVTLIIAFPALVTVGLDRPAHSGGPSPVQMLAPQDDQGGAGSGAQPEDTADLFKQIAPQPQQQ